MPHKPAAFLSYVHFDDEHDGGKITEFRKRLSAEVRVQTGKEFPIFQDKKIEWGENWQKRIKNSLNTSTFLIPVITPNFFNSEACLEELEIFLQREKRLGREDLILPVYYVGSPILGVDNKGTRRRDKLGRTLAARQYFDWRDLRFEPLTSALVSKTMAQLAVLIRNSLDSEKCIARQRSAAHSKRRSPRRPPLPISRPDVAAQVSKAQEISTSTGLPAAKTQPSTVVVDERGHGDYLSVSEAVRAAEPGSRILIRSGVYKDPLIIDKTLELIGDGVRGDVEIQVSGEEAVVFQTSFGRFANLTVTHSGDENPAIKINQGRIDIEECEIRNHGKSDVITVAAGAYPECGAMKSR